MIPTTANDTYNSKGLQEKGRKEHALEKSEGAVSLWNSGNVTF